MRGLAIGLALALILIVVPASHFLFVLLIPLSFFALLRYRTAWQPVSRKPGRGARRPTGPAGHG